MMKKVKKLFIFFALLTLLTGCVTNNGDIGSWYGNWTMTSMTVDGKDYTVWADGGNSTVWSFQNNIVCIQNITPLHDVTRAWATWTENDKTMQLDYRHHSTDEPDPEHSFQYTAPAWLLMDANTVITLHIDKLTGKSAVLSTVNAAGQQITYTLEKNY